MFDSSDKKEQKQQEENKEQETKKENKKGDYAEQVEKENNFYTMPTKESVSRAAGGGSGGKLMGIVIMVCGVVVLAGAVYFSYVYLIAPQNQSQQVAEEDQGNEQADRQQTGQDEQIPGTQGEQDDTNNQTDNEKDGRDEKEDEREKENGEEETATTTDEAGDEEISTTTDEADDEEISTTTDEADDEETSTTTDEDDKDKDEDEDEDGEEEDDSTRQATAEDADNDGLSEAEEQIFGTDPEKADTDEDGFEDGAEVLDLYDPAQKEAPVRENDNISEYADEEYGYSILYPAEWEVDETGDNTSLIFKSEGQEFIQLVIQENKDNSDIEEWYTQQFPDEEVSEDYMVELETWKGIKKQNRAIYYLTGEDKENIYILSYSASPDKTPQFSTVFNMMVKSFIIE